MREALAEIASRGADQTGLRRIAQAVQEIAGAPALERADRRQRLHLEGRLVLRGRWRVQEHLVDDHSGVFDSRNLWHCLHPRSRPWSALGAAPGSAATQSSARRIISHYAATLRRRISCSTVRRTVGSRSAHGRQLAVIPRLIATLRPLRDSIGVRGPAARVLAESHTKTTPRSIQVTDRRCPWRQSRWRWRALAACHLESHVRPCQSPLATVYIIMVP